MPTVVSSKVYLAGPMRGIAEFNFPAFDAAARHYRAQGWLVVSPAELDRAHGFDPAQPVTDMASLQRECIMRDTLAICHGVTHIALLPGWEQSLGVAVELALAKFLGLEVLIYDGANAG